MKPKANESHHYFASNVFEWRTDQNIEGLVTFFKKQKTPFDLWYIPRPESACYEIRFFAPQVEGAILLESYK